MLVVAGFILLGCSTGDPYVPEKDPVLIRANRLVESRGDVVVVNQDGSRVYPNIENFLEFPDPTLALYREPVTRDRVIDFFVERAGSESIALPILYYADRMDISLSLAFSLAWGESRFQPSAVNRNSRSIDRGVFQLNSRTFTSLSEEDFFTPEVNAFHGLRHLDWCLSVAESDEQALAIYNAGSSRVFRGQTPAITLRYVEKVTGYRDRLLAEFHDYILSHFPPGIA
jgi:hypothetical protein